MRRIVLLTSLLALLLGVPGTCTGQTATGQITGTVKDASGAVMPLVKITVSSQLTGLTRETTTSDSGNYVFPLLPVGVYSVTAEQQGFRVAKRSDIHLNVDQVMRVDLDLQVGEVTQTVEVQANAVAIDSETAAVGQVGQPVRRPGRQVEPAGGGQAPSPPSPSSPLRWRMVSPM